MRHGGLLGPLWRGAIWGVARPVAELRATARLHAAGAPVPRPVLVAAHRARGPLWSAVVGTVHVEGARDGLAWLAARPARAELLRGARAAGAAIRRFHDAGGSHADLQIKNLLLRERDGDTEVLVIDLDRARADRAARPRAPHARADAPRARAAQARPRRAGRRARLRGRASPPTAPAIARCAARCSRTCRASGAASRGTRGSYR